LPPASPGRLPPGAPAPAQLPAGEAAVALLEPGPVAGAELRCLACKRLLAELAAPPYRVRCRCGTVNEAAASAA